MILKSNGQNTLSIKLNIQRYTIARSQWYAEGYYSIDLNNNAWVIFEHSNDPEQLKIALKWSKLVNEKVPNNGINLARDNKDLKQALEKMKVGLPIWPQQ